MAELYESLGFFDNPFSRYSAEEEQSELEKIFLRPNYFDVVCSNLISGNSRFIIGDRGTGKTALMLQLKDRIRSEGSIPVIIDRYTDFPIHNNKHKLLISIIENTVLELCLTTIADKKIVRSLRKETKEKFSLILATFYRGIGKEELAIRLDSITGYKKWNFIKRLVNGILNKPLNILINGGVNIISDFFRRSMNLPSAIPEACYREYLPQFKEKDLTQQIFDAEIVKKDDSLIHILVALKDIAKEIGKNSIVVFFDKIDEYQVLKNQISSISSFLEEITTDTSLLQTDNVAFVFVIWSKIRKKMNELNVRFDKFKAIDVNWQDSDIEEIMEKSKRQYNYISPSGPGMAMVDTRRYRHAENQG